MYEAQVFDSIRGSIMKEKEWEEELAYVTNVSLLLSLISSSIATLGPHYKGNKFKRIKTKKVFCMYCTSMTG